MKLDLRPALIVIAAVTASAPSARAQAPPANPAPAAPAPARFRLVLNGSFWPTQTTFSDSRTFTEYVEQTSIRTSFEAGSAFGPDGALQVSLFRGLGVLVGYSYVSRDLSGTGRGLAPPPPLPEPSPQRLGRDLRVRPHRVGSPPRPRLRPHVRAPRLGALRRGHPLPGGGGPAAAAHLRPTPTPTTSWRSTRPRPPPSPTTPPASTWEAGSTTASGARGVSGPACRSSTARRA